MTIDRIGLKELVEKGSDSDLLREMIAFVKARMMDMEVESLTGAAHGERCADRMNARNGYRMRAPWATMLTRACPWGQTSTVSKRRRQIRPAMRRMQPR